MATYAELFDLKSNSGLKNKIAVAVTIKAAALIALTPPSDPQIAYADEALKNPAAKSDQLMNYVLAANASSSVAQITGASDATIQANVNTAVDKIIAGGLI